MQICKINKKTCFGCSKDTNECFSIENCKYKVTYMSKTEVNTILTKIKEECTNHEGCLDCGFNDFCNTL